MIDKAKIETWVKSLQGLSRWELMYERTDLFLSEDCIIAADVYDDFLIFRKLDECLKPTDFFTVGIEQFNCISPYYVSDKIVDALTVPF